MFTRAIVRPPASSFAAGLTTAGLGSPAYDRALEQHAQYCAALERCGLDLIRLAADCEHPDSCFVEDVAVLIPASKSDTDKSVRVMTTGGADVRLPHAVLTRPGAPSRQGEVLAIRGQLSPLFASLREISSPGTLDGGDVCEAGTHFFIGISKRTNENGARQLADILTKLGHTSSLLDIRAVKQVLHLKSAIAYLGDNRLAVTEALANREEFRGYDLIRVAPDEEYAANCIRMNGRVIIANGYARFERKLHDLGYETVALAMSEFQKMDGGLSCLSLRW